MENMSLRNSPFGDRIWSAWNITNGVSEWTSSHEGDAAPKDGSKLTEQHDERGYVGLGDFSFDSTTQTNCAGKNG